MNTLSVVDGLRRVLAQRDAQHRAIYTPEQVAHLIPYALMAGAAGLHGVTLPDGVTEYLGRLGNALGVTPTLPPTEMAQKMADYYRLYPVHPSLLQEVEALGGWDDVARALAVVLAEPQAAQWLPTLVDKATRTTSGPLARSALSKMTPKKRP